MHPMLLVHAASNINNVINFIEGVSFRDALSAIGDNEVEAALLAMQNAKKAHDVKREVESAVNHLQSAHIAYCSVWQQIRGSDFSKWTSVNSSEKLPKSATPKVSRGGEFSAGLCQCQSQIPQNVCSLKRLSSFVIYRPS